MKKLFTLCFLALMPLLAMADQSGSCGDNLTWTYTESTQTLAISGSGAMYDYTMDTPWNTHIEQIQTIEIGEGVTSIGVGAFVLCSVATSASIPNSVTKIDNGAFTACAALTSITIPANVTSIGNDAFMGCLSLATINVGATTPPALGSQAFEMISDNAKIYVPAGTADAYKAAAGWSNYASMIEDDSAMHTLTLNGDNQSGSEPLKVIKNGQLFIGNYTVAGQRVR